MGKWLELFIEQYGETNDYNDSEEVMGWVRVSLSGDKLTVEYEPDEDGGAGAAATEHYRLVRVSG